MKRLLPLLLALPLSGCGLFGGGNGAQVIGAGDPNQRPATAIYIEDSEDDGYAWGSLLVDLDVDAQLIYASDAVNWDVSGAGMLVITPEVDSFDEDVAQQLVGLGVPILGIGAGGIVFWNAAEVTELSYTVPSTTQSVVITDPEHPSLAADRWGQDEVVTLTTSPVTAWGINHQDPDVIAYDAEFGSQDFGLLLGLGHLWHFGVGDDGQGADRLTDDGVELIQSVMAWLVGVPGPEPGDITGG